jgi:hypothetical protein
MDAAFLLIVIAHIPLAHTGEAEHAALCTFPVPLTRPRSVGDYFTCIQTPDRLYLASVPAVTCFEGEHLDMLPLAIIGMIVCELSARLPPGCEHS